MDFVARSLATKNSSVFNVLLVAHEHVVHAYFQNLPVFFNCPSAVFLPSCDPDETCAPTSKRKICHSMFDSFLFTPSTFCDLCPTFFASPAHCPWHPQLFCSPEYPPSDLLDFPEPFFPEPFVVFPFPLLWSLPPSVSAFPLALAFLPTFSREMSHHPTILAHRPSPNLVHISPIFIFVLGASALLVVCDTNFALRFL